MATKKFGYYIPRTRQGGQGFLSLKSARDAALAHCQPGDEYQLGYGFADIDGFNLDGYILSAVAP